jgi:hypothetical protein
MEKEIKDYNELRDSIALINDGTLRMCNAKKVDEVIEAFLQTKDLIVAVFKYNTLRVGEEKSANNPK